MLILFDIDMTLLTSDHIGIGCLHDAGRDLFTPGFTIEGITFGGCLDPVIIAQMLELNTIEPSADNIAALRAGYHDRLTRHAAQRPIARALPGAPELVDATRAHPQTLAIGVLTGNFPETGTIKLTSAGFDPAHFTINAWGDDSPHARPHRSHLPPVAMELFTSTKGHAIDPERVIVIGDTIHDVTCALDSGCRSLAVATGHSSRQQLEDAGAHLVIDDLTDTDAIMGWMTTAPARR